MTTDTRPEDGPGLSMDRRRFLRNLGLGVGSVAVAGAAGVTWKAVDGGVFATGTGPAYAAWDALDAAPGGPMGLVRAAVLAANAHNAQPWLFAVAPDRIDLFADPTRTLGAMDPLLREMHISLGCALENLVLAGPPNGFASTVALLPDPADPGHIARVDLAQAAGPVSPLFDAIPDRHTDRAAYDTSRPIGADQLAALVDAPGTGLMWFTDAARMRTFGDLTIRATEAINADREQSADDFAWYRTGWAEIEDRKDGITIDPSGTSPLIRAVAKLLPVTHQQSKDGWLSGTRDTQIPTAAAFGALVVDEPLDPRLRLEVGRSWQRLHLAATAAGLSMQPLCQIPERIDRERSAGLPPEITTAMAALVPGGQHPIMTFRIGHPTTDAPRSPRRPAGDVVRP
jgi:nitroreductase